MQPYTITLECDFPEFWRYNLIVQGEVLLQDKRCDSITYLDETAPSGSELPAPPVGYQRKSSVVLHSQAGDALRLYIYIIPNTMPKVRFVSEAPPFEFRVLISHGKSPIFKHRYEVNQWSGENIELSL